MRLCTLAAVKWPSLKTFVTCAYCGRLLAWRWKWRSRGHEHRLIEGACPCEVKGGPIPTLNPAKELARVQNQIKVVGPIDALNERVTMLEERMSRVVTSLDGLSANAVKTNARLMQLLELIEKR